MYLPGFACSLNNPWFRPRVVIQPALIAELFSVVTFSFLKDKKIKDIENKKVKTFTKTLGLITIWLIGLIKYMAT